MTSALEGRGRVREFQTVHGSTNRRATGFVNFVLALAYHFRLNLPAAFTQPEALLLVEPCRRAQVSSRFASADKVTKLRQVKKVEGLSIVIMAASCCRKKFTQPSLHFFAMSVHRRIMVP